MLQITGPVRLDSTAGFSLDSQTVDIDLNARTVVTKAPVTGVLPIGRFSANSLSADIQGRNVVLDGGVHLRINGRPGKGAA
jgi:lipopolysaccharide export system protein LptC